jgi:ketosteroid isomerase-like protein
MSQENVELARKAIAAWNRGGPEAAKQFSAEDCEYHDPPTLPDAKVIRGRDAVAAHFAANAASVGEMRFAIREALSIRNDCVLLLMDLEVRGAGSGIDMSGSFAQLVEIANGELWRTRSFLSWEEALEAAGLSE